MGLITTAEEHERMLAEVEKLMDKSERRVAEEDTVIPCQIPAGIRCSAI
jgi:hypothetical protein